MLTEFESMLPAMLATLKTMVEYESPSDNKKACDKLVDWLAAEVGQRGGVAEILEQGENGNHLRATWGSGEGQILILCHIDTVWDMGEIVRRPFRVEGDFAYGPGIYDMKAGAVQALFAVDHLRKNEWRLSKKIVILFTSDEEIGSRSSRHLIESEALQSEAVLVLEPAIAPLGALKTSRKGVGDFHIKVEGVAAHAGSAPEKGASAILELAKQTIALHAMTDFDLGTTLNVGTVQGGTRSNVVAAQAEATVDLRVTTIAEAQRIVPLVVALQAETWGTRVTITGGLNRPPMERSPGIVALYAKAESLARELGIAISEGHSGGGSDGNFTAALGVPTLDGLGAVGDGAHALHEHILLSKMTERTALLARLLETLGK